MILEGNHLKLGDTATVTRCPMCDAMVIIGVSLNLKAIIVDLVVLDMQAYIQLRREFPQLKVYALDDGRNLVRVRAGDGVPVSGWRPEHRCGVPAPERPPTGFTPPCERGEPSMCGRSPQEAVAGVRNCDMCDSPPFSETRPALRPLDEAARLLREELGAVMIERWQNDRRVYVDGSGSY